MEFSSLQISVNVLISILFGIAGALGVWYKLKGRVEIQQVEIESITQSLKELTDRKKELRDHLHKRIDSLKDTVEKNREKNDATMQEIKSEMNKMELRIIQAIHEIKK